MATYSDDPENDQAAALWGQTPRCQAAKKSDGTRCGQPCANGTNVCKMHGGNTPPAKAHGEARKREAAAQRLASDRKVWNADAAPTTNPVEELSALSGKLREALNTVAARIEISDSACVCCGVTELDPVAATAFRMLMKEYRTALTDLSKLGIAERYLKLEEVKAVWMIEGIRAALAAVGITEEQDELKMVMARDAALARVAELEARQEQGPPGDRQSYGAQPSAVVQGWVEAQEDYLDTPAQIRIWARANGWAVSEKGRISAEIRDAYATSRGLTQEPAWLA